MDRRNSSSGSSTSSTSSTSSSSSSSSIGYRHFSSTGSGSIGT